MRPKPARRLAVAPVAAVSRWKQKLDQERVLNPHFDQLEEAAAIEIAGLPAFAALDAITVVDQRS